ncbi:hypothetical protein PVAND_016076 [Polypedilum vanderplanki]|uniref:AEBP2-like C-terminal SH3 domain-containing protein n=1 Tax=Polypedilum vanderplanki TaxID=319348 RepID=A0A9J6BF53_POLVA|nr:hypothetical protein PVAND_016076 [Polypedilum vanderplanki]
MKTQQGVIKKRRLISEDSNTDENKSIIEISSDDDEEEEEKRELSPVDSGFKEQSTSTSQFSIIQISQRGSDRIKKIQKYEESLKPTEKILRYILKVNNLIHPLETQNSAMKKFNPVVKIKRCSKYQLTKFLRLEYLIPKLPEIPTEFEFHGMILHSWRNYDGQHLHYFVRWMPLNVLDDEWIIADYARVTKLKKKVKLSEMNFKQKRIICEKILSDKF